MSCMRRYSGYGLWFCLFVLCCFSKVTAELQSGERLEDGPTNSQDAMETDALDGPERAWKAALLQTHPD